MNKHKYFKLLGTLGLLALGISSAWAQPGLCPSGSGTTLQDYLNLGSGGCLQIDGATTYTNSGFFFNGPTPATSILVTTNSSSDLITFEFPNLTAGQYDIGYNIDPPPILSGDSISLDPFNFAVLNLYVCPGSTVDHSDNYNCDGGPNAGEINPGSTPPDAMISGSGGNVSVTFAPTGELGVILDLETTSDNANDPTGTGDGFVGNSADAVPEPASIVLFGSMLVAAYFVRKSRLSRVPTR